MRHLFHLFLMLGVLAGPAKAQSTEPYFTVTFDGPVERYGHEALPKSHEWSRLKGTLIGVPFAFDLPDDMVFEDVAPHIVDVDRDGVPEFLVTESKIGQGSRLALWGPKGRIAAGDFIGTNHRWLAVIGAADLDGDGRIELAYVETPHVAPVLKIATLSGERITVIVAAKGLTNHRFGSGVIESAILDCGRSAVVLTANADWSRVVATRLVDGALVSADVKRYTGPIDFQNLPDCN